MTDGNDAPNVKIIPPLVYLAGIVIGFLATIWMPTKVVPNSVAWTVGGILICCGAALTGSALLKFKDVGTTVRPDRAASTLVISGLYKITRNPMYLALCLVQAGIGFLLNDWITLLFVVPLALILHFGVILPEEKYLEAKFGEPYLALKREVRRWI